MATTITTVVSNPSIEDLQYWGNLDDLPYSLDSDIWQSSGIYELVIEESASSSGTMDGRKDLPIEQLAGSAQSGGTLLGFVIADVEIEGEAESSGTVQCLVELTSDITGAGASSETFSATILTTSGILEGRAFSGGAIELGETAIQTHQDKVDAGYETWLEPRLATSTYTEIVDVTNDAETLVAATNITVTVTWKAVAGNPSISCKIETSADGEDWTVLTNSGFMAFGENFRYCRYTFTVTNGYVSISNINYRMDVKRKTDFGRVQCNSSDNGDGWISEASTPMLTGTWVPFSTDFVDVESLPRPNIVKLNGQVDETLTAFIVFEDVPKPQGFRIFVKDINGDRASALVDWAAYGV